MMVALAPAAHAAAAYAANGGSCSHTPDKEKANAPGKDGRLAPLLDNLGGHRHPISTKSSLAQRYFDQGLTLIYGFNHAEAVRSFREAARLDPECAMAYWGIALGLGPNINASMPEDAVPEAYAALQKALELAGRASEKEAAYIRALAARYTKEPVKDRKALDAAYATAMREVWKRHPDDLDAATLYAEALMDTMPWDYWTKDGKPKPDTVQALAALEAVLARNPNHPGANHYYIHAVEASPNPERGVPSADRLRDLVPGAGHLVHMPAHIYIRVGRYHDAVIANERAIEADNQYITQCHAQGLYPLAYVPHNHHFLWASAMLEGHSAKAVAAAREVAAHADAKKMREPGYGTLQHYSVIPLYALVRFGRWDEALKAPAPDKDLLYPTGVWHYARGMALTRKGRLDEAARELERLQAVAADPALESVTIWDINTTASLMRVAVESLAGEMAAARGDYAQAVRRLEEAVRLENELRYDEPPPWGSPMRQALGAVLLDAGRPADAERVYLEDLEHYPENGWSLFGLEKSLRAQGKAEAAAAVAARLKEAWANADVTLTASRF
jgi:tetratricopeptide (TPR) repeat protein